MPTDHFTAALRGMDSFDLPGLDDEPADPKNCRIEVNLRIGEVGREGANEFRLVFVTPAWLAHNIGPGDSSVPRYTVVVPEFTWQEVERVARGLILRVQAKSWAEFEDAFSRIAYSEYSRDPWPP